MEEGCTSVFLSTRGENDGEVSEELVKFLKFVKADLNESEKDFEDDFVKKLQETIHRVKKSREMEERYMIFEEMLRDERAEGRVEGMSDGILNLLGDMGNISDEVRNRIKNENNLDILTEWLKIAAKAGSIEEFLNKI